MFFYPFLFPLHPFALHSLLLLGGFFILQLLTVTSLDPSKEPQNVPQLKTRLVFSLIFGWSFGAALALVFAYTLTSSDQIQTRNLIYGIFACTFNLVFACSPLTTMREVCISCLFSVPVPFLSLPSTNSYPWSRLLCLHVICPLMLSGSVLPFSLSSLFLLFPSLFIVLGHSDTFCCVSAWSFTIRLSSQQLLLVDLCHRRLGEFLLSCWFS